VKGDANCLILDGKHKVYSKGNKFSAYSGVVPSCTVPVPKKPAKKPKKKPAKKPKKKPKKPKWG
jgi:hypothetical protein